MISLGAAVDRLVPQAAYAIYLGSRGITPESYAELVRAWRDDRPVPSYDDILGARDQIAAEMAAAEALDTEADSEIADAPIAGQDMAAVDTWISGVLTTDWPQEHVIVDLINAESSIPAEIKTILIKHARATYRIIEIQTRTLRLVRALLRKVARV